MKDPSDYSMVLWSFEDRDPYKLLTASVAMFRQLGDAFVPRSEARDHINSAEKLTHINWLNYLRKDLGGRKRIEKAPVWRSFWLDQPPGCVIATLAPDAQLALSS